MTRSELSAISFEAAPHSIVFASFSTSLDGFIARPNGDVGPLVDWYFNGQVEITPPGYPMTFRVSEASARYWRQNDTEGSSSPDTISSTTPTAGVVPRPAVANVRRHPSPSARRPASRAWRPLHIRRKRRRCARTGACRRARQRHGSRRPQHRPAVLNLGELDEIRLDLVPVHFHEGVRYLDNIDNDAVRLEHLQTVDGTNVTHLRYDAPVETCAAAVNRSITSPSWPPPSPPRSYPSGEGRVG